MKFSTRIREHIKNRAHGACEVCGFRIGYSAQIHHRKPRGMGGTKSEASGSISNGLYVHAKCHTVIESNREKAMSDGFLMYQNDEPENVPVKLWYGWHYLNGDGTVTPYQKEVKRGEAFLPSGLKTFSNVEDEIKIDSIEGIKNLVLGAVSPDESNDGTLADS